MATLTVAGTSAGAATTSGSVQAGKQGTGTSAGVAAATGSVQVGKQATGTSAGAATASGSIQVGKQASGTSAGSATASGSIQLTVAGQKITGTSAGVATTIGMLGPWGDAYSGPIALSGSGTTTLDLSHVTYDSTDPARAAGDATAETIWLSYTPSSAGTLALSSSQAGAVIEVYDSVGDLIDFGGGASTGSTPTVTITVSGATTYMICVHPYYTGGATTWTALPLTYTYAARTFPLTLGISTDSSANIPWTPAVVKVDVVNALVSTDVNFYVDSTATLVATVTSDAAGIIMGCALPLPTLTVGSHTLFATCVGTDLDGNAVSLTSATVAITVQSNALLYPTALAADAAPPTFPTLSPPRWMFIDPAPAGNSYTFAINPATAGSPNPPKPYTIGTTTSPDGQPLTWEGAQAAAIWAIEGDLLTQAQLEALQTFLNLNRRIWVMDEHRYAYVVTVEKLDAQPRAGVNNNWYHHYKMDLLIHAGPVSV